MESRGRRLLRATIAIVALLDAGRARPALAEGDEEPRGTGAADAAAGRTGEARPVGAGAASSGATAAGTAEAPGSTADGGKGTAPAARTGGGKGEAEIRSSRPAEIVGSESAARHELDEAQRLLDEGEEAPDDATRRAKYQAAKDHADRVIAAMPKNADAHFVHFAAAGRLAQMKGVAQLAIAMVDLNKELDRVLELDPDHANALAARGGMYMKLPRLLGGDKSKGVAYLERAVSLDATAIGKRLELAEAYRAIGRDGDAGRVANDARAVAVAEHKPDKVAVCDKFLAELRKDCPACAPEQASRTGAAKPGGEAAPTAQAP